MKKFWMWAKFLAVAIGITMVLFVVFLPGLAGATWAYARLRMVGGDSGKNARDAFEAQLDEASKRAEAAIKAGPSDRG